MTKEYREGDVIKEVGVTKWFNQIFEEVDLIKLEFLAELTKGHYVILGKGMRILNKMYDALKSVVEIPLGFEEVALPKIAPVITFEKAALLPHWNPHLLSVNPYTTTDGIEDECIMDPLQCTVVYQLLQGKQIDVSDNPLKWFDRSGPTYRNEDLDDLLPGVKQREFHRAEFVYIGTKEQVIDMRESCLSQLELLCKRLGFAYRVVVGAGCHRFEEDEKTYTNNEREIQVKDIEIYCPGYKHGFLEVSGNSVVGNKLTRRFSILGKEGEELWSGCSGVGLDRMLYTVASYQQNNLLRLE